MREDLTYVVNEGTRAAAASRVTMSGKTARLRRRDRRRSGILGGKYNRSFSGFLALPMTPQGAQRCRYRRALRCVQTVGGRSAGVLADRSYCMEHLSVAPGDH
jgi:hypothetical protein